MLIFYCREFKEAKSATPTAENTPFFKTGLEKMMKKEVKAVREDPVISATNTEHVVKTDAEELDRRNSSEKVGRGEESRSEQSRSRERDKRVARHTEERNSTVLIVIQELKATVLIVIQELKATVLNVIRELRAAVETWRRDPEATVRIVKQEAPARVGRRR